MSSSANKTLRVAVWDTYARKANGCVLHFDIIVPEDMQKQDKIFEFGKQYLKDKGEPQAILNASYCQFCHLEQITLEIKNTISKQGYFILEMEEIPLRLSNSPTRREMILYLKAHYEKFRFKNFSGISSEEVKRLLEGEIIN